MLKLKEDKRRLRQEQSNREIARSEYYSNLAAKETSKYTIRRRSAFVVLVLLFGCCGPSGSYLLSVALGVCLFLGLLEAYEQHGSR
jgi:hypothetical protein